MIGSKRLVGLENEVAAIRAILESRDAQAGVAAEAVHARLDDISVQLDASTGVFADIVARLDAIEAALGHNAATERSVERLTASMADEQARRAVLEQTVAKLEKRIDEQAEEARVTATALLQRLESALRARSTVE